MLHVRKATKTKEQHLNRVEDLALLGIIEAQNWKIPKAPLIYAL